MEKVRMNCKVAVSGNVRAKLIYSRDSFCFWGGADPKTGEIRDDRSDCWKKNMAGQVFAFPFGKGSSGAGLVILEQVRLNCAPAALINVNSDPVILTGPLIAKHFYNKSIPVVNLSQEDYDKLNGAKEVEFYEDHDYIDVYY
ncbi:DUF126 domain-containing protein [Ruminococcus sp. CLA-AA-H200]|uniref:DUF126 domain-containing protein n=1 Tax=Ruminococcus turbiniformis TaxID=2881258 RepID=A0ABS8FTK1_9FIRM|nr:DUF126 domain-containing protein [Ruminococcus turbiniformis]MCC2253298.1 DUF126 domain-containing protein [Ruminococcus turbiniformis]